MSDENKELESGSEGRQDEWSGTPLKSWDGSEGPENEAQREEVNQNMNMDNESTEIQGNGEQTEAPQENETVQPTQTPDSAGQPVDYSRTFRSLVEGDVVKGVVVHIDKEGVLVDVGTKSEGLIRPNEISRQQNLSPEEVVSVGDSIDVYVMQPETQDGGLMLSKKRADFEKAWERVVEAHEKGKLITAMVSDRVKGGLVVDLGIRGFVPASHVGGGNVRNLEKYIGQSIPLKVIEVDRERRKVVLSHKQAVEGEREKMRAQTVATLEENQIRAGIVRRITDYGAFVDLGGIDGLLHISEMSWTRINHPSEVVKVGQKIQVMVLKLDLSQGKVSLGLRQILPDPWVEIETKHKVGDIIKGNVSRLVPFGAFMQVEGGVEGIIPNSELAARRISKPEDVVSVGDEVEVKIIDLRPEERRMTLSVRQLLPQQPREREPRPEFESYGSYNSRNDDSRTTIGDLVGDVMREASKPERRERKRNRDEEAEAMAEAEVLENIEEGIVPIAEEVHPSEAEAVVTETEETVVEVEAAVVEIEEPAVEAEAPAVETEEPVAEAEAAVVETEEPVVEAETPAVDAEVQPEAVAETTEEPAKE